MYKWQFKKRKKASYPSSLTTNLFRVLVYTN